MDDTTETLPPKSDEDLAYEALSLAYDWRFAAPIPLMPTKQVVFRAPAEVGQAQWIQFDADTASDLATFIGQFLNQVAYFGLRDTYARIKQELIGVGVEKEIAWSRAHLSWALMLEALANIGVGFTRHYGNVAARGPIELVMYPLSALHIWSLREACRAYTQDIYRLTKKVGGAPFGNQPAADDTLRCAERMTPFLEALLGAMFTDSENPYMLACSADEIGGV